jgi:hypothetical protein
MQKRVFFEIIFKGMGYLGLAIISEVVMGKRKRVLMLDKLYYLVNK